MKPQKPLHSPTPQRKVSLMINHAIQDSVPEAWIMNHGDVEKTYLVPWGKELATIQGPAAFPPNFYRASPKNLRAGRRL